MIYVLLFLLGLILGMCLIPLIIYFRARRSGWDDSNIFNVLRVICHQDPDDESNVEYVRTDAIIEKAEEFIYSALNDGIMGTANIEDFMRLFKNYMKGE